MQAGFQQGMQSYSQSAGYAEQALNAIKVVAAFGQEKTEIKNYTKYLLQAKITGIKSHIKKAAALGGFFMTMYLYHAYAFYVGNLLIAGKITNLNSGEPFSSGNILSCFLGIMTGIFSLGMATPNIKAINEGQISGKSAYEVIERKPTILLDEPGSWRIKQTSDIEGRIEFRNVSFSYPSNKKQKILKNFSAVFEAGKTTAIVGASGSGKSTII